MSHISHLEYSKPTTPSLGYFLCDFKHVYCSDERWMICKPACRVMRQGCSRSKGAA